LGLPARRKLGGFFIPLKNNCALLLRKQKALPIFVAAMKQVLKDILAAVESIVFPPPPDPEKQAALDKRFAKEPQDWWHGIKADAPKDNDWIQPKSGGFPNVFDGKGLRYVPGDDTVAEQRGAAKIGVEITPEEWGQMKAYKLSPSQTGLHNVTLAKAIKPLWRQGKKPKEIGLLVGCSESTARHYCICFERAQKASNAAPLF